MSTEAEEVTPSKEVQMLAQHYIDEAKARASAVQSKIEETEPGSDKLFDIESKFQSDIKTTADFDAVLSTNKAVLNFDGYTQQYQGTQYKLKINNPYPEIKAYKFG